MSAAERSTPSGDHSAGDDLFDLPHLGMDDPGIDSGRDLVLPAPIDWDRLAPGELEAAWHELDEWVTWLRLTYGLQATVLPPAWHRHPELVWELSALHLHWLGSYHPTSAPSAPLGWHRDLGDALERLRTWTTAAGTRLDYDRPTRNTNWPGEPPPAPDATVDRPLHDRRSDFLAHVNCQVNERHTAIHDSSPRPVSEEHRP